jgi:hypothetical protein
VGGHAEPRYIDEALCLTAECMIVGMGGGTIRLI